MGGFSIWHLLIVAILLLLLFGGNRFSSMMGDVARGLKSFKQGMADEDEDKQRRYDEQRRYEDRRAEPPRQLPRDEPIDVTPRRDEPVAPPPPPRDDEAR
jgi:sec-independent protein translocase protein TatA